MRNFVNDAVFGTYKCSTCGVGQEDFFADLLEWWNSLDPMYQYAIMGSAAVLAILIVVVIAKPKAGVKGLEELLRLKMLKELAG